MSPRLGIVAQGRGQRYHVDIMKAFDKSSGLGGDGVTINVVIFSAFSNHCK